MSRFTCKSSGYFRNTCVFPMIAVLVLIFFHVGTATAQPLGDSLSRPTASAELAFVRDDQIWLVNADGTGLIQLTDTEPGVVNLDPAWSPDGQRLAFARESSVHAYRGIYVMDADGSNEIHLHTGGGAPAWSPDSRTILFSNGSSLSLVDVDADSSQGSRVLLDFPAGVYEPAWSPDGQTITFGSDYRAYDILSDLYSMNADGSNVVRILEGPLLANEGRLFYLQSAWSPDGQSLEVLVCSDAWDICYPDSTIAIVSPNGSGIRYIAIAGGLASPTWSPDGQWIAYGAQPCHDCQSSIRYVQVNGGTKGLVVDNGHSPAWRPDPDTLNAPDDPDGPIKQPDEPKDPDESKIPRTIKLPGCGSKCEKKEKLNRADFPDRQ